MRSQAHLMGVLSSPSPPFIPYLIRNPSQQYASQQHLRQLEQNTSRTRFPKAGYSRHKHNSSLFFDSSRLMRLDVSNGPESALVDEEDEPPRS